MTTADRIRLLRRHGLENAVIAAVLGVDCDAIADHIADPSIDVTVPGGGGGGDVSGLLPLDGSRAMTGPLAFEDGTRLFLADSGTVQLDGGGPGETAYLYATNESSLYADDLQEGWFYPGAVDLADYRYSHLTRLRASSDIDHGLYVSRPGQDAIYGPDGLWFNQVAGVPATSLFNTAPGVLELDNTLSFKGAASDIHAGATLEWSDDWYGLVLKGRPGSGDAELYLIDPDDENNNWVNIYPSVVFGKHGNGNYFSLRASGLAFTGTPTTITMVSPDGVQHPVTMNDDGTLSVATGGSGGGGASASFEFENDGPGGEGPFVIISIGRLAGDPGYVGYGLAQITRTQGDLNDVGLDLRMVPTGGGNVRQFSILMDGTIGWHNGGGGSDPDVQLRRAGAGVLEVPQHGGGFKLWNDDGSVSKTVRLNHAGTALELV